MSLTQPSTATFRPEIVCWATDFRPEPSGRVHALFVHVDDGTLHSRRVVGWFVGQASPDAETGCPVAAAVLLFGPAASPTPVDETVGYGFSFLGITDDRDPLDRNWLRARARTALRRAHAEKHREESAERLVKHEPTCGWPEILRTRCRWSGGLIWLCGTCHARSPRGNDDSPASTACPCALCTGTRALSAGQVAPVLLTQREGRVR